MPTPRLSLPYIVQSQAQKEVTHAEALNVLDALVQAAVETRTLSVPPANPVEGELYLVGVNPTGAWSGHGNMLAQWIGGAWAFRAVAEGFRLWLKDEKTLIIWTGTAWARGLSLPCTYLPLSPSRKASQQSRPLPASIPK